jgi:hypothetical protein
MLGGSDVVIASRYRVCRLDGRDRLRRQLLAISDYTVTSAGTRAGARPGSRARPGTRPGAGTDAGTRAAAGPGDSVRHDSSWRPVTGEQSLHTARTGRRRGYDGDVDEY